MMGLVGRGSCFPPRRCGRLLLLLLLLVLLLRLVACTPRPHSPHTDHRSLVGPTGHGQVTPIGTEFHRPDGFERRALGKVREDDPRGGEG
jgi:hypothetical protein